MSGPPELPGDLPPVATATDLSGGMIAHTWRARLTDGRDVVVKHTNYDARLEADGLGALAEAGAPVPEVLGVDERVLVITHVSGRPDWAGLGRALADLHRHTGDTFGWHVDNVIGPLHQDNTTSDDWPTFYAERRIRPHLDLDALPSHLRGRLERALDGPLQQLLGHGATPSLVHGDLWSGNVVDGAWLIDPAVHRADREFELAFMDLFGGFPAACWDAYESAWPLDAGWQERRPALQLYHLLVHVALFGSSYVSGIAARLDRLGW